MRGGALCTLSRLEGWKSAEDGEVAAMKFMFCIEMKLFIRRVSEVSRVPVRRGDVVDRKGCIISKVTTQQKQICT